MTSLDEALGPKKSGPDDILLWLPVLPSGEEPSLWIQSEQLRSRRGLTAADVKSACTTAQGLARSGFHEHHGECRRRARYLSNGQESLATGHRQDKNLTFPSVSCIM